jgi:hypothetical protein
MTAGRFSTRLRRVAVMLGIAAGLAPGCAGWPGPRAAAACGNPCASTVCPSAFRCDVDVNCTARCQPEPVPRK